MTDEEFIQKAKEILNRHNIPAQICNTPDIETLFLGSYGYADRAKLVQVSKEILELEGYEIVNKAIES